jgi:hypothetical protein
MPQALGSKVPGRTLRLAVEDEVDMALAVQVHILGAVARHVAEAQAREHRLQHPGHRGGELHKFKAHQAHWVLKQICHGCHPHRVA